jgi:hypothetical protein
MWHAFRARWQGEEYSAGADPRPDQLWMRLYRSGPAEGFEEVEPGRYLRTVTAAECDTILYVTTVCEWLGAPFQVHDEDDDQLLIEYTGGLVPVARRLQLQRLERGVYRAWVPRDEVRMLRENAVVLTQ